MHPTAPAVVLSIALSVLVITNAFSTGKGKWKHFYAWLVLCVTSSVKTNIFLAAFSGCWVPDGVNEGDFNPGSLTEEPGKRLQKCTSVPQLLEPR